YLFFFSSRRRHTRLVSDWSSDVCSSDLMMSSSIGAFNDTNQYSTQGLSCKKTESGPVGGVPGSGGPPSGGSAKMRTGPAGGVPRSEERRVGKESRSRWSTRQ